MAKVKTGSPARTISIISVVPVSDNGGEAAEVPGGKTIELHALGLSKWIKDRKEVDFGRFMGRWNTLKEQIGTMIGDLTTQAFGKMALDEVEVSIAVSGEGSIGIATAKGEASIVLKFKKK